MQELRQMSRAGKTFYFASLWLERSVRQDVAIAYSFCRTVDDIADDQPQGLARSQLLAGIIKAVRSGDTHHSIAAGMVSLIRRFPQIKEPTESLVEACAADGPGLLIETEGDLLQYAHGVAGNVGLLMYPILGGTDPRGLELADQLGMAMQCTNIARDVLADLRIGRTYLPSDWLVRDDIRGILRGDEQLERSVVQAVEQVLAVGERLYRSGIQGLSYLPARSRLAIRVAAECYAAIGSRVIRNGRLARNRAVVPLTEKILLALRVARTRQEARA
jgi:phytoene synthase